MDHKHFKGYDLIYIDPPWNYYGRVDKMASAKKYYHLMDQDDIEKLPIKKLLNKKAACFVWATGPKLDCAIAAIKSWGLYYRGIAHIWIKTSRSGNISHGQGVPPTYSKPTSELLLLSTTNKLGRPLKLYNNKIPQIVLHPKENKHSKKPEIFRELIEEAYKPKRKLEIFARKTTPSWDVVGNEVCNEDVFVSINKILNGQFVSP